MWLQYRESTWAIIRRQLLPVSGICAIPPTHLNKQIHRDARQPQKCWNHKCHAWLFLFSNAWFFPKTSSMICTGTTLISCPYPYNPHSAAAQNQLELKLEMFSLCICIVDPCKNSVLFLVEFHFRISCLSTKLLLSLFQVYALMHTLWAWSGPVQAT